VYRLTALAAALAIFAAHSKKKHAKPAPTPVPDAGPPGLTTGTVEDVFKAHMHELRGCFAPELAKDPKAKAKLYVKVRIGAAGAVVEATAHDGEGSDAALAKCVEDKVLALAFPAPNGGGEVAVDQPLWFSAALLAADGGSH
jgi:hypothetical protein